MTGKRIGISIGDAAGVGPELALRTAAMINEFADVELALIGDHGLLSRVGQAVGLDVPPSATLQQWFQRDRRQPVWGIQCGGLDAEAVRPGLWTADTGAASHHWVEAAARLAIGGQLDAIVTGPIQKEAWQAAGIAHPGHTEMLAELCGSPDVRMMLTSDALSCVLATIHLPLADVPKRLTEFDVLQAIRLGVEALRAKTIRQQGRPPHVAVCGLNPHAGENGLMGHGEEQRVIAPAISAAKAEGIDVVGPLSPDTAFVPARRQVTDLYVCMYHDQGLIPLKAIAFDDAVNVTLGLPITRVSVDHGTAMDIAWGGVASASSMLAAVRMARELA